MGRRHRINLSQIQRTIGETAYELTRIQYSQYSSEGWKPAINAYRCRDCIEICVELAGVEKSEINLTFHPGRLVLRGHRQLPEPSAQERPCKQILAMEIDSGLFEREILLPSTVTEGEIRARQENGLLWITVLAPEER